jgi:LysR family hydrogen peroxide-inducible transcriptional activator
MISLKQLHYALAVARTRHFKKAAEDCHVSQSAMSTAIAELESQLGVQLFERDNKKVLVTPVGAQILARARDIKLLVDDVYKLASLEDEPFSQPMSLGVIPTIGPFLLPKVLPELHRSHPDFRLRIVEAQSQTLVDRVRDGELDTAILALPYDTSGLHAFEFWQEDFFAVSHKDSWGKRRSLRSDELDPERLLLLSEGHCLTDHALSVCRFPKTRHSDELAGASLYTLLQMAAGRMGTTLVPEMALEQLVSGNPELRAVHLDEPGPHRRIAFVCRLNYAGVPNIERMMAMFRTALESHRSRIDGGGNRTAVAPGKRP